MVRVRIEASFIFNGTIAGKCTSAKEFVRSQVPILCHIAQGTLKLVKPSLTMYLSSFMAARPAEAAVEAMVGRLTVISVMTP